MKNEELNDILKIITKWSISKSEALSNVPIYAKEEAFEAIMKIKKLEDEKFFQPGLYYIVLVDLAHSTKASAELGPETNRQRIELFIKYTIKALSEIELSNSRDFFVKEIGDASLFIFSNFNDILKWSKKLDEILYSYNIVCDNENKPNIYKMYAKKCIHVGEVHYSDTSNPIALAVNQVFKIEKLFKNNEIGITELVREIISPLIKSEIIKIEKITDVLLPGDDKKRPVWRIVSYEKLFKSDGR